MPRLNPIENNQANDKTVALRTGVEKQLGVVPNIFKTMAHSTTTLEAYLQFSGILSKGKLCPKLREKIALTTAGSNGCDYCASAHTLLSEKAGIEKEESMKNLKGQSTDPKSQAVLNFVSEVLENHGKVNNDSLTKLALADVSDEEVVEIIAHIAMNIFTNYFNNITAPDIDFPLVSACEKNVCSA